MTTRTQKMKKTEIAVEECAQCGMPREEWASTAGYTDEEEGKTYCCEGCADGTGCTCSD